MTSRQRQGDLSISVSMMRAQTVFITWCLIRESNLCQADFVAWCPTRESNSGSDDVGGMASNPGIELGPDGVCYNGVQVRESK